MAIAAIAQRQRRRGLVMEVGGISQLSQVRINRAKRPRGARLNAATHKPSPAIAATKPSRRNTHMNLRISVNGQDAALETSSTFGFLARYDRVERLSAAFVLMLALGREFRPSARFPDFPRKHCTYMQPIYSDDRTTAQ
jgi:hypothetical protein